MSTAMAAEPRDGVLQLLRTNRNFSRLWAAQLISFAGDWINSVALLGLILKLTGNGMMVSLLIVANTLPLFVLMPLTGVVADRFDRRRIMLTANLLQAVLALGFLLVRRPHQIWMVYLFSVAMVTCEAFFAPAAGAALPNLVTRRQLMAANALSGSAWGTMVAVGSALGGLVAGLWGREAAFILNALSFLCAAFLIRSVRAPFSQAERDRLQAAGDGAGKSPPPPPRSAPWPTLFAATLVSAVKDFADGLRYAMHHRAVLALLLLKSSWGLGGGVIALLSVIPVVVFHAGDGGIGQLYAARGVGSLMGPLIAQAIVKGHPRGMARMGALGVIISGTFYATFACADTLQQATAFVFLAHLGGGMMWVMTSSLVQRTVADRMLGRISSLDMAGLTLTMTLSNLVCGVEIRNPAVGPRGAGLVAGLLLVGLGALWLLYYALLRPPDFEHRDVADQDERTPAQALSDHADAASSPALDAEGGEAAPRP